MIWRRDISFYENEFFDILKIACSEVLNKRIDYVKVFEEKFAEFVGTDYAISTPSGRFGMLAILQALNLKKNDEIIFPAYTLKDLIVLVEKLGFKPVLVDVDENTFTLDPEKLEKSINRKTKVIVATHIFGLPCNMKKIKKIAESYGIYLIEDCCHAHGAEFKGTKVGSIGDAGFFSFNKIKLINTFDGGIVTTNDERIAKYVKKETDKLQRKITPAISKFFVAFLEDYTLKLDFSNFLFPIFYNKKMRTFFNNLYKRLGMKGVNKYKYSSIQAFVGLKQLEMLEGKIKRRNRKAKLLIKQLSKKVLIQHAGYPVKHSYFYFVIRTKVSSEIMRKKLLCHGIDVGVRDEITDDCTLILKKFYNSSPITHEIYRTAIQVPFSDKIPDRILIKIAKTLNNIIGYDDF
ncbi:MAG: aminotransferase class I/II-fold pyridoxal phosphate-dependent enzyme [Candidatus Aenigmarchaeota archaeon]|nr:aminotransferase class I/II-fold pyridoxal phosphate-dependent enzyme [Candidatus Aenigmarchaeota archaeon]